MIRFKDAETEYLAWLVNHPNGYVLNVRRKPDPDYVVLHRASCGSISSAKRPKDGFTGRNFAKCCADSVDALRKAAKQEGRIDGTFSKRCGLCRP